jgi:hypothetical protein
MSANESFNGDENTFQDSEINIPRTVRFWLLLLLEIPSIICSFFLLFHLLINKTLRCQLTNHVIIVLLIIGLIIKLVDIPFLLSFLLLNMVQPSMPHMCLISWFMDVGLTSGCTIIMAWGSVHRYLVIFHDRMFLNKKKRFIFHYFPLIILLIYIWIFYIIAIVFPPCMNTYNYKLPVCNDYPCYLSDPILGIWDSVVNNIIPVIIISISSLVLPIRVWYQKRRLHRRNLWRKQRKMTVQLFCCCILYLIPNLPLNIFIFAHFCGLSKNVGVQAQLYFDFLCYFVILLYPFVCLGSLSEIRKKIKWQGLVLLKQPRQVAIVRPQ